MTAPLVGGYSPSSGLHHYPRGPVCPYSGADDVKAVELPTTGRLWAWIHDPAHVIEAFLARDEAGTPVGLAHFRPMPRPLAGAEIGFLDDLFVDPAYRGGKVARLLLDAVAAEAARRGWAKVRWLTADDNYRARSLYDRLATRTMWITYEMSAARND